MPIKRFWTHKCAQSRIEVLGKTGSFAMVKCCRTGKVWHQAYAYILEHYV